MRTYKSLPEIAEALNNDLLQINELPEVVSASGMRGGDRDMSVAIDDQTDTILLYDEARDLFVVEPYEPVDQKIERLNHQIEKLGEVIKELSGDSFLIDEVSFLEIVRDNLKDYKKSL